MNFCNVLILVDPLKDSCIQYEVVCFKQYWNHETKVFLSVLDIAQNDGSGRFCKRSIEFVKQDFVVLNLQGDR